MKILTFSMGFLSVILPLSAQERTTAEWDVEIPGPIADGTRTEPTPKPEPIDFKVLTSNTKRIEVQISA